MGRWLRSALGSAWERARALVWWRREEAELREEMRFHIEQETSKLLRQGWAPGEARREAHRRFGGVDRMRERARDERGARWLEDGVKDLAVAARRMRSSPGATAVTVGTLALGVGATSAMFSLVDGVLLSGLPFPEASSLVAVWERGEEGDALYASYLNFADWRDGATSLEALAAFTAPGLVTALTPAGGARASVSRVSADFFTVLGVEPAIGRVLAPDEHRPSGPTAAVVSHAFWQQMLGAVEPIAGTTVSAQGTVYDVVGVMPPSFDFPGGADVWVSLDRAVPWTVRANHVVQVVGRLRPGAEVPAAAAELDRLHADIRLAAPEVESVGVRVRSLLDETVGDSRRPLLLLLGAAGVLLLVACANLATTALARGSARRAELGVRASLGASRPRLVRQLVAESALAAALGGVAAVAVAAGVLELARAFDPGAIPRLAEVGVDLRVLAFTAAVAAAAVLGFGLIPALRLTGGDLAGAARGARGGADRASRRTWRVLMAGEVALAVVLLTGGALLLRSLDAILDRDLGYRPEGVATARLHLPPEKFETAEAGERFLAELTRAIEGRPGVDEVGVGFLLPVRGSGSVGGPVELDDGSRTDEVLDYRVADAGFFTALRIPLLEGRLFGPDDRAESPHVAVVSRSMAERLWPGESAIGKRFEPGAIDPYPGRGLTVVGVVGDVRTWSDAGPGRPTYYVAASQRPAFLQYFGLYLVARGDQPASLAAGMRAAVRDLDPDVPASVGVLSQRLGDSAGDRRFTALVLGAFAALALTLAAVGIYGVVAYAAAQRVREMGVRMALGARPAQVRGTVQAEALAVVAVGLLLGIAGALATSRLFAGWLVDVPPLDPPAYAGATLVLVATAWLASWIPALRGTRVDPVQALREGG